MVTRRLHFTVGTIELNNAVIGCRPGHPIIRACLKRVVLNCRQYSAQVMLQAKLKVGNILAVVVHSDGTFTGS